MTKTVRMVRPDLICGPQTAASKGELCLAVSGAITIKVRIYLRGLARSAPALRACVAEHRAGSLTNKFQATRKRRLLTSPVLPFRTFGFLQLAQWTFC